MLTKYGAGNAGPGTGETAPAKLSTGYKRGTGPVAEKPSPVKIRRGNAGLPKVITAPATEYFSERLFGGNPVYDEDVGLVNWLVGKVVKNPTVMKVLSSAPVETGSEGLEEMSAAY